MADLKPGSARNEEPRTIDDLSWLNESREIGSVAEWTAFVKGADLSNGASAWNAGRHSIYLNPDDVGVIL